MGSGVFLGSRLVRYVSSFPPSLLRFDPSLSGVTSHHRTESLVLARATRGMKSE